MVEELCSVPSHVFVVFLGDVGVSTVRKRVYQSGAWCFVEKPPPPFQGRKWEPKLVEKFQKEFSNAIADLYLRHKSYFDAIVDRD